jgi:signal peptidase I
MSEPAPRRSLGRSVREFAETLLLAAAIYFGVQAFVPPYAVDGASMDPTLHDGEHGERLLVNRSVYAHFDFNRLWNLLPLPDRGEVNVVYPFHRPERGDVIVFYPPTRSDKPYIKRVIGLPGDQIGFAEGYVLINGQRLDEPYIDGPITFCAGKRQCDLTVPPDTVYVLGDNRDNSLDSRVFGPVSLDAIVGQAWLTNWPPSDFGFVE